DSGRAPRQRVLPGYAVRDAPHLRTRSAVWPQPPIPPPAWWAPQPYESEEVGEAALPSTTCTPFTTPTRAPSRVDTCASTMSSADVPLVRSCSARVQAVFHCFTGEVRYSGPRSSVTPLGSP